MLEMCLSVVKRKSCRYSSALHPGTHAVLPRTIGISNGLSHTLEVYRKVLHGRPLVYGYTLENTTTDLSSHVLCVYRETPLGYLIHLRKSLWSSFLEPYTEKTFREITMHVPLWYIMSGTFLTILVSDQTI